MKRDERTSWATPLVVEHDGRAQVVTSATNRVRSYDLRDGAVIWECGGQTVNAIPSPIVHQGVALCMTGYRGAAAYAIPLESSGDVTASDTIVWQHGEATPYVPSPIVVGSQLYFTSRNAAILSGLNAADGTTVFPPRRLPEITSLYASPVAAAGRIYFVGRDGTTLVLEHSRNPRVLATNPLDEPVDASPALVGKQMFLRGAEHLYCITQE